MENEAVNAEGQQKDTQLVYVLTSENIQVEQRRRDDPQNMREISLTVKANCVAEWRKVDDGIEVRSKDRPSVVAVLSMPAAWRDKIWAEVYEKGVSEFTYDDPNEGHKRALKQVYLGIQVVLGDQAFGLQSAEIRAINDV